MTNFDSLKFSKIIKKLIQFKAGTTKIPIKNTSWEELIWAALVFMFGEDSVDWNSQSHEKSVDLKARIEGRILKISAKGGVIKNNALAVSSYRLTTFFNLQEKLQFIATQHRGFDFYLICAREVLPSENIVYHVLKTSSGKLAPAWFLNTNNWRRERGGYELKNDFGFNARIVSKMSDQLWYEIPMNYFSSAEGIARVEIPRQKLGRILLDFLKSNSS